MARPRTQLHDVLTGLEGVSDAYFQADMNTQMVYPCIVYSRDNSYVEHADNEVYYSMKRYMVTVIDRDPDSLIPDLVEGLPLTKFDRFYVRAGLNHFVFNLYF